MVTAGKILKLVEPTPLPDLAETSLFEDYATHGDLWYILVKSVKYGHIVGIVRDGSVTIFNVVNKMEYFKYVADEIFPLVV